MRNIYFLYEYKGELEGNCCGKCNGSGKPSAEALLVAIGLLEGFYPIYEKVEGSDPLPEVIDWLRKAAREEQEND